jgi:putative flippase GtrA
LGAAVQVALFTALAQWLPPTVAAVVAVELTVLHNFLWHERFTWGDRRAPGLGERARRLWRFHAANGLVSIAGNAVVVYGLTGLGAPGIAAQAAAIALCAPLNFWVADRWVYGS